MCGRYALALAPAALAQRLIADGLPVDEAPPAHEVRSGYNVAPGSHQPVYRALPPPAGEGEGERGAERFGLTAMRWGLIPPWSWPATPSTTTPLKPPPNTPTPINCRDTALRRPTGLWHTLKHTHRCLVPAQGFYEWHAATRTPHYVQRRDRRLLLLAGLWACHTPASTSPSSPPYYSFTIVTTAAAPATRFLHARMPVVLDAGSEGARMWLARGVRWGEQLQRLCVPWEGPGLEVYPVAAEVGDVRRDESCAPQDTQRADAQQADKHPSPETSPNPTPNPNEEDDQEEWQAWPDAYKTAHTPEAEEEEWETWPEAFAATTTTTDPPEPAPTTTTATATLKRARGASDASPPPPPAKAVRSATSSAVDRRGGRAGRGRGGGGDGTMLITRFFKR
ncbi:hypothetical protein DFP73DRAFT_524234 [Morchella snyderi]|nr:hypothetical protein DFP73DRAFT_524234 [Morchella snyderi]